MSNLTVRSNVARDMLGTADEFGAVPKMVVEYVSNGLDNPDDPSAPVTVRVGIKRYGQLKTVAIQDNGCGMDAQALDDFFIMHKENAQRAKGRRARGRFGTGKSAAFGVGTSVVIDTVRNGRRWRVELTKDELSKAAAANRPPVPIMHAEGVPTDLANGTLITVSGIAKRASAESIAGELRRRLGRQIESHEVYVEGQRVRLEEPVPATTWEFRSDDDAEAVSLGSGLVCVINAVASGETVDEAIRGVVVTSRDVPVAQYLAAGDMAKRLFGVCEVPALDDDNSTPGPFTDRRDLSLNLDNDIAARVDGWVRLCLEQAASELQKQERDRLRRARDEALEAAASRAESVLNEHYKTEFRTTSGGGPGGRQGAEETQPVGEPESDEDGNEVVPNPDGPAGYQPDPRAPSDDADPADPTAGDPEAGREGGSEDAPGRPHPRDPLGDGRGDPVQRSRRLRRRKSTGGFHIDYQHAGAEAPRAAFYETDLSIVINLDHPLLASVSQDRDLFQGLAFTIAAEEYAQATANQLLVQGQLEDPYDALDYERRTMDTLSRAFAQVFVTLAKPAAA
jgi:hypothetical protein